MKLFTAKMKLLTAVVLDKHADGVTRELLSQGVLDFVKITSFAGKESFSKEELELLGQFDSGAASRQVSESRRRIETIYQQAELATPPLEQIDIGELKLVKLDEYEKQLDEINRELGELRDRQKVKNQEILKLEELKRYLGNSDSRGGSGTGARDKFLIVRNGKIGRRTPEDLERSLSSIPHFSMANPSDTGGDHSDDGEKGGRMVIVSLKREASMIDEVLSKYDWTEEEPDRRSREEEDDIGTELDRRISVLRKEQEDIRGEIGTRIHSRKPELDGMWKNLRLNELYGEIQDSFSQTSRTVVFSGWLPSDADEKLEKGIRDVTGGECIIRWSVAEEFPREKIPVIMKSPKALAPFQMLVENYAMPEYGTVNPVPFVAAAYLVMFGLMFGDAGQGLVIALIGFLGLKFAKKASSGVRKIFQLLTYCGSASIVTGILFGSYFGYPVFPPVWFNYHSVVLGHADGGPIADVYGILGITIYFGITVIGLGLVLNWINLFRKRNWFPLLLDKTGLLGGWMYGCGVYTAFYFVGQNYKGLPASSFLLPAFGIPVVILLFKAPLHHFMDPEKKKHGLTAFSFIDFLMEWIVELLEIFSGYLANTLSFMRVAGLGIAHVSLMAAFDSISAMAGGGIGGVVILILGNILVIGLEGLSAGIQALRLNYYEFFSKYFTGKGIAYNPVSIRSRRS